MIKHLSLRVLGLQFLLISLSCSPAFAECMFWDIIQRSSEVPYFVRGEVVESTAQDKLNDCMLENPGGLGEKCKYTFKIKVKEFLKGSSKVETLRFQYGYWIGCPGVDTFSKGKDYVFAVKEVSKDGFSSLMAIECGNGYIEATNTDKLQKLRAKLK